MAVPSSGAMSTNDLRMCINMARNGSFDEAGRALLAIVEGRTPVITTADVQTEVEAIAITYTTGDPSITADGAITVADGATPTVDELLEFCVELNAKVTALAAALQGARLMASS